MADLFASGAYERETVTIGGQVGVFVRPKAGGLLPAIASAAQRPERSSQFGFDYRLGVETIWLRARERGHPRMIHGIASTPRPSVALTGRKQSLSSAGCEAKLPIPIFFAHARGSDPSPLGEVTLLRKSESQVYIRGVVFENAAADHAWALIQRGEANCFSVLSERKQVSGIVDGIEFVDRWKLKELSICKTAANAGCGFEIFRD